MTEHSVEKGMRVLPPATTEGERAVARRKNAGEILSFTTIHQLGKVFKINGWGLAREVGELVHMARQSEDEGVRLRAISMLRQLRLDAIRMSGLLAKVHETRTGLDGVVREVSATVIANRAGEDMDDVFIDDERGYNPDELDPELQDEGAEDDEEPEGDGTDAGVPAGGVVGTAEVDAGGGRGGPAAGNP